MNTIKQNNYTFIKNAFLTHKKCFGETDNVFYERLFARLTDVKPKNALDMWCGNGDVAKLLSKTTSIEKVLAVDISQTMISEAIQNNCHDKVDYQLINTAIISDEIAKDDSIDVAYSTYVLMEPEKEEEVLQILKNIFAKLKPDAKYISLNSNIWEFAGKESYGFKINPLPEDIQENDRTTTYLRIGTGNTKNAWLEIHDYYRSIDKYAELFEAAGFVDVKVERILIPETTYVGVKDEAKTSPAYLISGQKPL